MNPYDGRGLDEQLELEEEAAAIEARLAPVLIDGDERVEGFAAIARKLGMSRQALAYGLSKLYPELEFIWRDVGPKPESMVSSLQAVKGQIIGTIATRVRQERIAAGPEVRRTRGPRYGMRSFASRQGTNSRLSQVEGAGWQGREQQETRVRPQVRRAW